MRRACIGLLSISGLLAGCGVGGMDAGMAPPALESMARKPQDLRQIEDRVARLLEASLGSQSWFSEVKVREGVTPGKFPFEVEVTVKIRSSTPGFAGGYLYRTELQKISGVFNAKTGKLEGVKRGRYSPM